MVSLLTKFRESRLKLGPHTKEDTMSWHEDTDDLAAARGCVSGVLLVAIAVILIAVSLAACGGSASSWKLDIAPVRLELGFSQQGTLLNPSPPPLLLPPQARANSERLARQWGKP